MEKDFKIQQEGSTLLVKLGLELTFENSLELQQELMKYRGQDIQKIAPYIQEGITKAHPEFKQKVIKPKDEDHFFMPDTSDYEKERHIVCTMPEADEAKNEMKKMVGTQKSSSLITTKRKRKWKIATRSGSSVRL